MTASHPPGVGLRLMTADALDVAADAVFLTIDGASPKLLGNLAHQFIRRFPEVDLPGCIEEQIEFPLPLGTARRLALADGSPYRCAVLLTTLHHVQVLGPGGKLSVIRSAFSRALEESRHAGVVHAVTTVLSGGWRLPVDAAFRAMLGVLAASAPGRPLTLTVCVREGEDALRRLAQEAGTIAASRPSRC